MSQRTDAHDQLRSFGVARLAKPDGFELEFTQPVDGESAGDPASYRMSSFTYPYHHAYGGEELDTRELRITAAEVAKDGKTVRLRVDGLRATYVHELHAEGVRSDNADRLGHPSAWYTLNRIPE